MGPRNAYKDILDKVVSPIACVNMNHQNQLEQMANGAMFATVCISINTRYQSPEAFTSVESFTPSEYVVPTSDISSGFLSKCHLESVRQTFCWFVQLICFEKKVLCWFVWLI
jgi:hypothetical protein